MQLTIKTDFEGVRRSLAAMREDIGKKALASALNKTIAKAKTEMSREITREYNVTSAYVKDRLTIRKASVFGGAIAMQAELRGGGRNRKRSANVIAFADKVVSMAAIRRAAKQGKKPQMLFKFKKAAGKKQITGAFVGNKGRTVFIREGAARLPIKPVQTIDVAQMFNQRRINGAVLRRIREDFPELFAREARYFTDRFSKG